MVAAATVVGLSAAPAAFAVPRTFVVTLATGSTVTVTVDVPAETPADAIAFPGLDAAVLSVTEVTPAATATPGVDVQLSPTPTQSPAGPGASPTPAPGSLSGQPPEATGENTRQPTSRPPGPAPTTDGTSVFTPGVPTTGGTGGTGGGAGVPGLGESLVPGRNPDGSPVPQNPSFSLAVPGAAPIGVPNFFIDRFRIPPFLLPIYQAAGIEYGVRWEILAAINEIETDYGRNLNVSSAGAMGWMQFIPSTWRAYGTDANGDGFKDPYNPVDAIFAAARYLKAAGAETDIRRAVFAYNHADWYVDSVLLRARVIGGLPSNFVGSLTGLTQGRFPVAARATYADDLGEMERSARQRLIEPVEGRRSIAIFAKDGSRAIAVNDGRVLRVSKTSVTLRDVYGNTYSYARLGSVPRLYPAARERTVTPGEVTKDLDLPTADRAPSAPASAGAMIKRAAATPAAAAATPEAAKERLFANPLRRSAIEAGGGTQVLEGKAPSGSFEVFRAGLSRVFGRGTGAKDVTLKPLRPGAKVIAGTVLGRVGDAGALEFSIKPAGRGAPRIDPKPILDGWKLLESTAIYRAAGKNPFTGDAPSIGQVLLMDKQALQRMVLADPRVEIYECGREDVQLGQIDRRVLATLEFLSLSGLRPTVTSLTCGHGFYTSSGNVSHHSSGNAVDIARINGVPVLGNQSAGSVTDVAVRRLATLQGLMKPAQIISLLQLPGTDNTLAMGDHADHIHVGFQPLYNTNSKEAKRINAILEPKQWVDLVDRLSEIDNPVVARDVSKSALKVAGD
ncbi:MAG: lytic murein transglycosylase [Solirubrobacteraceae bacterium]